ncbi:hypothetical protein LAZ67_12002115 [Cordylochernes scorpioides]|uniref:Mos1 transposase HTH domain-containing protein n=1 Tax=Cordylochernes scorpioides TaxID=51811 RepID=A0ABY6L4B6_9ARAC|nr:hypothetical protein LAZ67_12002115 [Cordylochernes scorpioides]
MPSSASPGTSGSAGKEPGRPSIPSPTGGQKLQKDEIQKTISRENSENRENANPPAGVKDVNLAAARDVTLSLPASTSFNGAARVLGNWADCIEDLGPEADDAFTVVKGKKRRRESTNSPTAAAPSSNIGGARTSRRPQSSLGSVPRAQEIRTTRAHISEARARQASSSEEHCVYLEHGPELQPFHYLRALDRMLGGTAGVIQVSKVNGHQLLGLANRGLAERLINEGLEVEGTLLRAFPFRKRAERITVGNLPFFVEDSAIIKALGPFGRITSIAPKMMKAGPYTYTDGRREAFIVLHEGVTTERLPTRLNITIKGEAWPAYLSSGIKCSRCHGQGHRRANCPLLAGRVNTTRSAPPASPAALPPTTTPAPPQRPTPQHSAPAPPLEISGASPAPRAAIHPAGAPRPSPTAPSASPTEETPPAPPPVTPDPSSQAPRDPASQEILGPANMAQDIEMTAVEESIPPSASSNKKCTRIDLAAFIKRNPSVSFAGTDALGLGREEVLDLLSSRTKAHKRGRHLTPPQSNALAGLKCAADGHRLLCEAYGEDALSIKACEYWFRRFKSGDFDTRDKERGGRPIKFEDAELDALLDEDSSQTHEELAETLGVTQQAISNRLKVMDMVQKQGNWVPYELKAGNIERRIYTCELLLKRQNRKGFFASNRNGGRKVDSLRQPKAQKIVGFFSVSCGNTFYMYIVQLIIPSIFTARGAACERKGKFAHNSKNIRDRDLEFSL